MAGNPHIEPSAESRRDAYVALVAALAALEPEALARAAAALEEENSTITPGGDAAQAVTLARAHLASSGNADRVPPPEGARVFSWSYPATVYFETVGTGSARAMRRRANQAVGALLAVDRSLCAGNGPLPDMPSILNLDVWLGSADGTRDALELELVDPPFS